MNNTWALYQSHPSFVLGFHGTEKSTVTKLVNGATPHLKASAGKFEWLGHGIYFWENDPQRALEWAEDGNSKTKVREPDAVGAILDLKFCLDLTTRAGRDEVEEAYKSLVAAYAASGTEPAKNIGGPDMLRRELDCQVIQSVHSYRKKHNQPTYDSVRAPFREAEELYPGAGFHKYDHIQIAIINPDCIKGYFKPICK
ncbi:hypothetical protein [Castellaniella sp. UC4442_H9]